MVLGSGDTVRGAEEVSLLAPWDPRKHYNLPVSSRVDLSWRVQFASTKSGGSTLLIKRFI